MKAQSILVSPEEGSFLYEILMTQIRGMRAMQMLHGGAITAANQSMIDRATALLRKLGIEVLDVESAQTQAVEIPALSPPQGEPDELSIMLAAMAEKVRDQASQIPTRRERIAEHLFITQMKVHAQGNDGIFPPDKYVDELSVQCWAAAGIFTRVYDQVDRAPS